KVIADESSNKVIGGAIIGPHATELIAEIALAIQNGLTTKQVAETVHAHPTLAESVHEATLAALDGALHIV
ncbi:MAG TPA: dihydrolipoyl dehydrogenase, partial [Spirochaetes bacterium]|nr:dihydrolipoyl dehydrogenase [Spirochaetota bacterium]